MNAEQTLSVARDASAPRERGWHSQIADDKAMLRGARDLTKDIAEHRASIYWTDMVGSALLGYALSTLGMVPLAVAYMAAIVLWSRRERPLHHRLRAVGRMALTNYLTQTAIGLLVLTIALGGDVTRTAILAVVLGVWVVQLAWSPWWLERFQFGPVEWLWRSATYRSWQPLRRSVPVAGAAGEP